MDSRVYLTIPKEHMKELNKMGQWVHGLFLEKMNPYVTKDVIESHFEKWGVVTFCDVKMEYTTGFPRALGYVCFSSEEEVDTALAAGPHNLAGMEVDIKRVVSPKKNKDVGLTYMPHRWTTTETSNDQTYTSYRTVYEEDVGPISPMKSDGMTYVSHRRISAEKSDPRYISHRRTSAETGNDDKTYVSHRTVYEGDIRPISPMKSDGMTYVSHRRISAEKSDDMTCPTKGLLWTSPTKGLPWRQSLGGLSNAHKAQQ
ncbi:uncharacterized protein LOC134076480 isoform X1 [Sardina pilchardus]|uniref:uncharacterized protein LOC134076480 isoform X1 n=1 Tax=Sardina pilchardus TaxID=27697 RepID=UPI002E162463